MRSRPSSAARAAASTAVMPQSTVTTRRRRRRIVAGRTQPRMSLVAGDLLERRRVHAVALVDAVRHVGRHRLVEPRLGTHEPGEVGEHVPEDRRRGDPVHVVVAVDDDRPPRRHRRRQPRGGRGHARQVTGLGQLREPRVEKSRGLVGVGQPALHEQPGHQRTDSAGTSDRRRVGVGAGVRSFSGHVVSAAHPPGERLHPCDGHRCSVGGMQKRRAWRAVEVRRRPADTVGSCSRLLLPLPRSAHGHGSTRPSRRLRRHRLPPPQLRGDDRRAGTRRRLRRQRRAGDPHRRGDRRQGVDRR